MKSTILYYLTLISILAACSNSDVIPKEDQIPDQNINFSEIKVGQKSFFKSYTSSCLDLNNDFEYTDQVLMVEVIEESEKLYFQESLINNSNQQQLLDKYEFSFDDEFLYIPDRSLSRLFFFFADDKIKLKPNHDVILRQESCILTISGDPFIGEEIAFVPKFQVGDINQWGKTAVSCVPGFFDFDAYLIYDENQLYMSHIIRGNSTVEGWVITDPLEIN